MAQLESQFQKKVIKELESIEGLFFWKVQAGSIRGIPDIVGCYRGRFFAWELKKSEVHARETTGRIVLQKYRLSKISEAGGIAEFVYPENLDTKLKELTNEKI